MNKGIHFIEIPICRRFSTESKHRELSTDYAPVPFRLKNYFSIFTKTISVNLLASSKLSFEPFATTKNIVIIQFKSWQICNYFIKNMIMMRAPNFLF